MFKSKKPEIVQGYLVDEDGKEYTMDEHGVKIEIPKAKVVPIKATDVKFSDLPPMYSYNTVVVEAYENGTKVTPILNSIKPDELKILKKLENNTKITVFPNNKHRLNNSMKLVHVEDGTWGYLEDKFIFRNPGGGGAMSAAGGAGTAAAGGAMSAGGGGDTSSDTSPTPMRGGGRKLKRKSSRKRSNKKRSNRKRSNRRKSNKRRLNRKRTNKKRSRRY